MERHGTGVLRLCSSSPSIPLRSSTPLREVIEIRSTSPTISDSNVTDNTADSLDSCYLPSLDISLIS